MRYKQIEADGGKRAVALRGKLIGRRCTCAPLMINYPCTRLRLHCKLILSGCELLYGQVRKKLRDSSVFYENVSIDALLNGMENRPGKQK